MKIVRAPRQGNFTIIPNATARDSSISFRARGILTYLLSHEDGWTTSADRLKAAGKEGRDAVGTALKELIKAGYLTRSKKQNARGHWEWTHYVFDTPQPVDNDEEVSSDPGRDHANKGPKPANAQVSPTTGKPSPGNQEQENQPQGSPIPAVRRREDRALEEAFVEKNNQKTTPPPTSPGEPADPNSANPEGEGARILIQSLPPMLKPRSPRQNDALLEVIFPLLSAGWEGDVLLDYACRPPLPETILNPPGFIRTRLAALPSAPARSRSVPWCGQCDKLNRWIEDPVTDMVRKCPACHPSYLDSEETA